jgi:hypothetical protein
MGIYDRSKLEQLTARYPSHGVSTVIATPDEISDALIVEYNPRFMVG